MGGVDVFTGTCSQTACKVEEASSAGEGTQSGDDSSGNNHANDHIDDNSCALDTQFCQRSHCSMLNGFIMKALSLEADVYDCGVDDEDFHSGTKCIEFVSDMESRLRDYETVLCQCPTTQVLCNPGRNKDGLVVTGSTSTNAGPVQGAFFKMVKTQGP